MVFVFVMLIILVVVVYLLMDCLYWMLGLVVFFGVLVVVMGVFFFFVGRNLLIGLFMVLGVSMVFLGVFLFGLWYGVIVKWWVWCFYMGCMKCENMFKVIYYVWEGEGGVVEGVMLMVFVEKCCVMLEELWIEVGVFEWYGLVSVEGLMVYFILVGW